MASMRKCICCNTSYKYCPNCSSDKKKPSYMAAFCSESCKDLWDTLSRYSMEMISKSEAIEKIQSLCLKPIDTYTNCVQRDYVKIMEDKSKFKRGQRATMQIFDDAIVEPVAIEPEHEVVIKKENE